MANDPEPGTEALAVSDERDDDRHLDPWRVIRAEPLRRFHDDGKAGRLGGGRAGAGGHGGRRENRDEWDIE